MKFPVKVPVSAATIDAAMAHGGATKAHCPIAVALAQSLGDAVELISVDDVSIRLSDIGEGLRYYIRTPAGARKFVEACTRGDTPKPITVTLTEDDVIERKPRQKRPASQLIKRAKKAADPDHIPREPGRRFPV